MSPIRHRLSAALVAALLLPAATPAQSLRVWTYIGGCANADWRGMVSGRNVQGQSTCWSATEGGLSGASPPTAADDVLLQTTGPSSVAVNFADVSRAAFTGRADELRINGAGGGYAGLELLAGIPADTLLEVNRIALGDGSGSGLRGEVLQAGGQVRVGTVLGAGYSAGNSGRYTLSGGTLDVPDARFGLSGSGLYTQSGGTASFEVLSLAGNGGSTGAVALSGGTLTINRLNPSYAAGTITVDGKGTLITPSGLSLDSFRQGGQTQLNISDKGARWQSTGAIQVGVSGNGSVSLGTGAFVSSGGATLGVENGSSGEVSLRGAGVLWISNQAFVVGDLGRGLLTIADDAELRTVSLNLGTRGSVVLDGGTLIAGSIGGTGAFDWRSGTLRLGSFSATTSLGNPALPLLTTLTPGRNLQVSGTLGVGSGLLVLSGGTLEANGLSLAGGAVTVVGGGIFDLATVRQVSGSGTVLGAVRGDANTRIQAGGGVLTLGNAARDDGFDFDGTLNTQGQQVVLLDANGARLGALTVLPAGGRLASANGLLLDSGRSLQFDGAASIEGNFTNSGSVAGTGNGTLTFFDDVSGPGSFAGDLVFRGLYTPAATVTFGGGRLRVDPSGTLVLAIQALAPGGSTRLTGIGALSFAGALRLDFGAGLSLPDGGARLDLLDFDSFSGAFDPARITVSGVPSSRLDYSQLALDGTLLITAVPEPAAAQLWLAGLCAWIGHGALRRRKAPCAGPAAAA